MSVAPRMTPAFLASAIATTNPKAMPAAQPQATAIAIDRASTPAMIAPRPHTVLGSVSFPGAVRQSNRQLDSHNSLARPQLRARLVAVPTDRDTRRRREAISSRPRLIRALGAAPKIARVSAGKANANVPGRSREQRLRALRLANEIRLARAQLKKDLASGKIELAQIIAQPPAYVRTARVRDVLLAVPKIGSVKAGRILADCGIAHSKTLGGLTERQRTELLNRFRRDGQDK
jgi:hypothetical protein